jgi:hypothetical protein
MAPGGFAQFLTRIRVRSWSHTGKPWWRQEPRHCRILQGGEEIQPGDEWFNALTGERRPLTLLRKWVLPFACDPERMHEFKSMAVQRNFTVAEVKREGFRIYGAQEWLPIRRSQPGE